MTIDHNKATDMFGTGNQLAPSGFTEIGLSLGSKEKRMGSWAYN